MRSAARPRRKPWKDYRPIFLTDKRIDDGIAFYREHRALLERIGKQYGVAPRIHRRDHRRGNQLRPQHRQVQGARRAGHAGPVLPAAREVFPRAAEGAAGDAATTIWPARSTRSGLVCRRAGLGPVHADQHPRFRAWTRIGDGRIDLQGSLPDIFASVANYFAQHGWVAGGPVAGARAAGCRRREPLAVNGRHAAVAAGAARGLGLRAAAGARSPARRPACRRCEGADGAGVLVHLPEFLRDHALQPQPAVRDGGATSWRRRSPPGVAGGRRAMKRARWPRDAGASSLLLAALRRPPDRGPRRRAAGSSARRACRRCRAPTAFATTSASRKAAAIATAATACRGDGIDVSKLAGAGAEGRAAFAATATSRPTPCSGSSYRVLPTRARLRRARHRLVLRQQVPRLQDLQPGDLRHVRVQRRQQDAAAAQLCARHQPRERQERDRARQRSRPVPREPPDRPVLRRRGEDRHLAEGHRPGRSARHRSGATRAQELPPPPVVTSGAPGIYLQVGAFADAANAAAAGRTSARRPSSAPCR